MRSILMAAGLLAFVALLQMLDAPPRVARAPAAAAEFPVPAVLGPEQPAAAAEQLIAASPPPPPPRPAASPPPPPPSPQPTGPPRKPCAAGCEVRGVCNSELGRCDCPLLTEGEVCEKPAVPKCASQWGLELPIAPCQALALESEDWRDFPATCECLFDCHRLNQRLAYVSNCVNASGTPILPLNHESIRNDPAEQRRRRVAHAAGSPFVDGWGDGRWVRQAYTPGAKECKEHPEKCADDYLLKLNQELAARLKRDGEKSVREGLCSGRGIMTAPMPWQNGAQARWVARGDGRSEHCVCIPGWYGANCETGPGDYNPSKETDEKDGRGLAVKRHCVHGCSGRGVCRLNWCHCVPGTYGTDCSLGTPDGPRAALVASLAASLEAAASKDGGAADRARASSLVGQLAALDPPAARNAKPALAAAAGGAPLRHWAYNGKVGWSPAMVSKAAPPLPAADRSLRVYVYDLPPKFNTWLAAHFRRPGRWDQSYLYSLDAKLHRWLLHSPHRTFDPKEADYFFVPAYLHLGFYDYEFGLYWLSPRGNAFCNEVFRYVQRTWPFYNASRGADHVFVMTNDKGATFIRGSVPALQRATLVTQWGWVRPHIHHRETDVVVPPMLKVDKLLGESPFLNGDWLGRAAASAGGGVSARLQPGEVLNASSPWRYEYLLSFVGSVRFHTPGYSMGVRQSIFRKYNETAGFFLRDLRGDSKKGVHKQMKPHEYLGVLQRSKFCLAPSGMGFSTRSYESIAQGCVPLVIQDDPLTNTSVDQAFDELLPWRQFSVRLRQRDIPHLPELLASFPDGEWRRLKRNLGCVWSRVLWLHPDNEAPGEQLTAAAAGNADATGALAAQPQLRDHDAYHALLLTLARRAERRRSGQPPRPFDWRAPATSCAKDQPAGETHADDAAALRAWRARTAPV